MQTEVRGKKKLRPGLHRNQNPKHYLCFKTESFITSVEDKLQAKTKTIYGYIYISIKETDAWSWFSDKWSVEPFKSGCKRRRTSGV